MPSACDKETPPAVTPPPLPSILDLGRHAMAAVRLGNSLGDKPAGDAANNDAQMLAYERKDALAALATSLPAKTLADAAVQLLFVYDILAWLDAVEIDARWRDRAMERVFRGILSAAPVVAMEAGLAIDDLDFSQYLPDNYLRGFAVEPPRVADATS